MVNVQTVMSITHSPTGKMTSQYLVSQHMILLILSSVVYSVYESLACKHLLADSLIFLNMIIAYKKFLFLICVYCCSPPTEVISEDLMCVTGNPLFLFSFPNAISFPEILFLMSYLYLMTPICLPPFPFLLEHDFTRNHIYRRGLWTENTPF